jgi:hypothetical protein
MDTCTETFRFKSICAKTGTYIDVTTNACTNDPDLASVLAKRGHMSTLKLLATNVKGRIIDSQCP